MTERQLDLFSRIEAAATPAATEAEPPLLPDVSTLDDATLVAVLPDSSLAAAPALAAEAARRRIGAAVPALAKLCRRFKGFGRDGPVPEQQAAIAALRAIGGKEAAVALSRLIAGRSVLGPGIATAIHAAAALGATLPGEILAELLRHADPAVRADACRCAGQAVAVGPLLIELLGDLNPGVADAAALALGRMGRLEARPALMALLRTAPSREVIEAVERIADADCRVLVRRIALAEPALAEIARAALETWEDRGAQPIAPSAGNHSISR